MMHSQRRLQVVTFTLITPTFWEVAEVMLNVGYTLIFLVAVVRSLGLYSQANQMLRQGMLPKRSTNQQFLDLDVSKRNWIRYTSKQAMALVVHLFLALMVAVFMLVLLIKP